jgi:hypothetical protein
VRETPLTRAPSDSVGAFIAWCVVGAALCFGVLSLLTVGPFVLLVTFFLCGFLLWRLDFGWGMAGMISGAGLPLLYVAWLNRSGPGEVCTYTATSTECGDESSPWPLAVVGVLLLVVGVVVFVRQRGR